MQTTNYSSNLLVDKTPHEVFNAINDVSAWWSIHLVGNTKSLNDEFTVRFGETYITMKVTESINDKKIVWLVTDCYKHWVKLNKIEWIGTNIVFEISSQNNKTKIDFTHIGLVPELECYDNCEKGWNQFFNDSLAKLIIEGKGKPY